VDDNPTHRSQKVGRRRFSATFLQHQGAATAPACFQPHRREWRTLSDRRSHGGSHRGRPSIGVPLEDTQNARTEACCPSGSIPCATRRACEGGKTALCFHARRIWYLVRRRMDGHHGELSYQQNSRQVAGQGAAGTCHDEERRRLYRTRSWKPHHNDGYCKRCRQRRHCDGSVHDGDGGFALRTLEHRLFCAFMDSFRMLSLDTLPFAMVGSKGVSRTGIVVCGSCATPINVFNNCLFRLRHRILFRISGRPNALRCRNSCRTTRSRRSMLKSAATYA